MSFCTGVGVRQSLYLDSDLLPAKLVRLMALTSGGEAASDQPEVLAKHVKGCAGWFFWIAGLTLVNSVMMRTGSETSFLIGLTITQVVDVLGIAAGPVGGWMAGAFALVGIGLFVLLGLKARVGERWAFVTGLVLYGIDTLLSLVDPNFISIAFHGWALITMGVGLRQAAKLHAVRAAEMLPPVLGNPAGTVPAGPVGSARIDQAAAEMEEMTRRLFAPSHRYAQVDPKSFRGLDQNFYDTGLQQLQALGFRHVSDEENLDLKGTAQDPRCFIRSALGRDGTVMAALFQMRPKWWLRLLLRLTGNKLGKTMEFETEFSGGGFLATSNAQLAASLKSPPQIVSVFLPWETPLEKIFATHLQGMKEYLNEHPTAVPVVLHTREDVRDSQNRMQGVKAAFRKNIGGLSREELLANADTPAKVEVAEQLWVRLQERRTPVAASQA